MTRFPVTRLPGRERGAALVVGLILLMVLTLLAISGMNTATTELALSNNNQYFENAFQAAESGVEEALSRPDTTWTLAPNGVTLPQRPVNPAYPNGDKVVTQVTYRTTGPVLEVDNPSSLNAFEALHFDAVATGESFRGATAEHRQGFYFIAPKSGVFGAPPGGP